MIYRKINRNIYNNYANISYEHDENYKYHFLQLNKQRTRIKKPLKEQKIDKM